MVFRSSREERRLLARNSALEYYCAVYDYCGHRPHVVRFTFLAHLLRRATPLDYFAAARQNAVFYQPQGVVAMRATRSENFDLSFSCHSNSPLV